MAGIAIPLIAAAVPLLQPLIEKLVLGVQGLFGSGTGETKASTALAMLQKVVEQLAAAGKLQGVPDATALATMIETVVQQLKASGQLPGPVASPAAGKRVLLVGTIQEIA